VAVGGFRRGDAGFVGDPGRVDPDLGERGRGVVCEAGEGACREAFLLCFGLAVGCFRVCEAIALRVG